MLEKFSLHMQYFENIIADTQKKEKEKGEQSQLEKADITLAAALLEPTRG